MILDCKQFLFLSCLFLSMMHVQLCTMYEAKKKLNLFLYSTIIKEKGILVVNSCDADVNILEDGAWSDGKKMQIVEPSGETKRRKFDFPVNAIAIHKCLVQFLLLESLSNNESPYIEGDRNFLDEIIFTIEEGELRATLKDEMKAFRVGWSPLCIVYTTPTSDSLSVKNHCYVLCTGLALSRICAKDHSRVKGMVSSISDDELYVTSSDHSKVMLVAGGTCNSIKLEADIHSLLIVNDDFSRNNPYISNVDQISTIALKHTAITAINNSTIYLKAKLFAGATMEVYANNEAQIDIRDIGNQESCKSVYMKAVHHANMSFKSPKEWEDLAINAAHDADLKLFNINTRNIKGKAIDHSSIWVEGKWLKGGESELKARNHSNICLGDREIDPAEGPLDCDELSKSPLKVSSNKYSSVYLTSKKRWEKVKLHASIHSEIDYKNLCAENLAVELHNTSKIVTAGKVDKQTVYASDHALDLFRISRK